MIMQGVTGGVLIDSSSIQYPTSDGRPMGETDVHREQIVELIHALDIHFDREDVYVSGNLLMFYEEGRPRRHVSPDVLVTFGIPRGSRNYYKVWEEGRPPDVIFEITSQSTRREDLGKKRALYARLGVPEYYIFDPLSEYLKPRLRAYRLEGRDYVPVVGEPLASSKLELELRIHEDRLRLWDPAAARFLPTRRENERARRAAEQARTEAEQARSEAEAARAEAQRRAARAEAEVEALRAELERLRRQE